MRKAPAVPEHSAACPVARSASQLSRITPHRPRFPVAPLHTEKAFRHETVWSTRTRVIPAHDLRSGHAKRGCQAKNPDNPSKNQEDLRPKVSKERSESPLAGRWGRVPSLKSQSFLGNLLHGLFGMSLTVPSLYGFRGRNGGFKRRWRGRNGRLRLCADLRFFGLRFWETLGLPP